jgi:hypothetical protein
MSSSKRPIFDSLLFCFVIFTIVRALSGGSSQDAQQMQQEIALAKAKLAVMATDQQHAADTIKSLQSRLKDTNKENG